MLELSPFAPLFLTIAISEMVLGAYVLSRGPHSPVNRIFFYFTMLAGVGSLLDLMVASLTGEAQALWAARLLVFLLAIELGTAYYLNSLVPFDTGLVWIHSRSRIYPLIVGVAAIILAFTVQDISQDQYGWSYLQGWAFVGVTAGLLTYVLSIAISHQRKKNRIEDELKRRQAGIFAFALAFPASLMVLMLTINNYLLALPRILGIGELFSVLILSYGILRYDLFVPLRVTELAAPPDQRVPALIKGRAYLFEQQNPDRLFVSVMQEMQEGMSALIICRTHPDQLRARYRLTVTPFIWLAQSAGPGRVDPSNLQMLTHVTLEYLAKGPSLIVIEGLEYLLVNNELNKVLKFLGQLRDNVIVEGSIMLVTVDPRTLTDRQRAILEREFETIE